MAEARTFRHPHAPGERDLPDHVTEPLLTLITQRSLDADYEHAAARRRAAGGSAPAGPKPRRTAGLVLLVFGALVTVAAVQTSRNAPASDASRASLVAQINLRRQGLSDLQAQLDREASRVLALRTRTRDLATADVAERSRLQRLGLRTGFGAVEGPGVQVTLNSAADSAGSQLVRDADLTLLTDALWAAGAEAISVNGQRLTVLSAFRNVGIAVLVNTRPINPPYVLDVIGDADSLPANLLASAIGERWYALKDTLGFRFDVRNGGRMSLPAASPPRLRWAEVAPQGNGRRTQMGVSGS
jgi:uncharacterized protein YlxW (UPF0749 family)